VIALAEIRQLLLDLGHHVAQLTRTCFAWAICARGSAAITSGAEPVSTALRVSPPDAFGRWRRLMPMFGTASRFQSHAHAANLLRHENGCRP